METQTWWNFHNKFISAENIIILSLSLSLSVSVSVCLSLSVSVSLSRQVCFYMLYLKLQNSKCGITVHMCTMKKERI